MLRVKGILWAALSSSTFGLAPLFTLLLLGVGYSSFEVLTYRWGVASLCLGAYGLLAGCDFRLGRRELGTVFLLSLTHEQIPDELDFASIDVSFISLKLILPAVANVLKDGGYVVSLVKPQFEAGREKVGKKGVVRDPVVHKEVLEHYLEHAREAGFGVLGLTYSPIRGPEGNIEYLGYLKKCDEPDGSFDLSALVAESHSQLKD